MRIVGIACLASMALVGVVVGFRLVALARRSRQLPEALLGLGLLLAAVVGAPLSGVGRMPALVATPLGDTLFQLGLACTQVAIACFFAFTWQVFRRRSAWAMALVLLACGVLGAQWQGLLGASQGATMQEIFRHTRAWGMGIVATLGAAFLWTGIESFAYHRKLVRRLSLGLAEPEIVNRFWLWGVGGFATTAICGVLLLPMARGVPPMQSPTALATIALCGLMVSTCWWLAFFPPRAYLERLRAAA